MITCKRATELISKEMDEPLTIKEGLELKLHLFICEFCEKFKQQLKLIRRALFHISSEKILGEGMEQNNSSENAKDRIKQKLRQQPSNKKD